MSESPTRAGHPPAIGETSGRISSATLGGIREVNLKTYRLADRAPVAVVVFLHGVGGNESSWGELGGPMLQQRFAARGFPFVVIAPAGEAMGWPESADGSKSWATFLASELIPWAKRSHPQTDIGLMGVSAGGARVLEVALRHPELASCVAAHSPALHPIDPEEMPDWARNWDGWQTQYGNPIDPVLWKRRNPIHLVATRPSEELRRLGIYLDVGADDHLGFQKTTGLFAAAAAQNRVPHELAVRPGGHGDAFYRVVLPLSVEFLSRCIGVARAVSAGTRAGGV